MSSSKKLIGKTVLGQYVIRKSLGSGSFGDVYEAENLQTHQIVALKFEVNASEPKLPTEYRFYKGLEGMDGIPKVYGLHEYGKGGILVMDQMGPSLEGLFKLCSKQFSLKTVLMIADQIFRIMQWIHECGILHRDIKPENFLVGRHEYRNKIYLIDFGISAGYLDPLTHEHCAYARHCGLVGTTYYVSVPTHLGDHQSRRDDLESVLYVLIRFLKGALPWQHIKAKTQQQQRELIAQSKMALTPEMLCEGLPSEFRQLLQAVKKLRFDERPNYAWFRRVLRDLMLREGLTYDSVFDWDENAPIHSPQPGIFLSHAAAEFQRQNERLVRDRPEKLEFPDSRKIFYLGK
jgi:casein kinase 1